MSERERQSSLTPRAREDLRFARALLERNSLAARLADVLGAPIERGFAALPERWSGSVQKATEKALSKALDAAVRSLGDHRGASRDRLHKLAVAGSGALGGAGGLATLALELPLSTTLMMRSIADIARSEGEPLVADLQGPERAVETRLACLEVFALGGPTKSDDAAETGYFGIRAALAAVVADATRHLAGRRGVDAGAPAILRLITAIASRFGVVVSEKVAAQALPIVGAAGGALVNTLFLEHFQGVARGHFLVRRLEREFGADVVRTEWDALVRAGGAPGEGPREAETGS